MLREILPEIADRACAQPTTQWAYSRHKLANLQCSMSHVMEKHRKGASRVQLSNRTKSVIRLFQLSSLQRGFCFLLVYSRICSGQCAS